MIKSHEVEAPNVSTVACPQCSTDDSFTIVEGRDRLHSVPGLYFVAECRRCGLWFQNPRPSNEYIQALYPSDYGPHTEATPDIGWIPGPGFAGYLRRRLQYAHFRKYETEGIRWRSSVLFDPVRRWRAGESLVPAYVPGGQLLEVGCGTGSRLLQLRKMGWCNLSGIELAERAASIGRSNGLDIRCGRVEDTIEDFRDTSLDVIVAPMVLEHLANQFDTVRRLARKLRPGGQFLFSTITRTGIDSRWFGTYWRNLDLPRHLVLFRTSDLSKMLSYDFEGVEMFFQAAPIDLAGSAQFRETDGHGKLVDKLLLRLGESRLTYLMQALAILRLTSRVSVRCTRKG